MQKDKILFLIDRIESGGAENVILKILEYFSIDNQTSIITNYSIKKEFLYKVENTNYIDSNIINEKTLYHKIISLWYYFLLTRKIIKQSNPKFVLSFLERSNIVNIISGFFTKHKSIISIRNNLSTQYENRNFLEKVIAKFLIKLTYNKANLIIVLSNAVKYDLINNFKIDATKIHTLYNPYNIDSIVKQSNESLDSNYINLYNNYDICITMGRLSEQKGYKYLINSFKIVIDKNPKALLLILGDGELKNELQLQINKLNLKDNIKIIGFHKNPYKFVAKAKLFIFSSLWEGFGNALLESMICRTMVISTDCDFGPKEILSDLNNNIKYGKLIPKIDINNSRKTEKILAITILEALSNSNLRYNYEISAFKRAKEFDNKIILEKWNKLIKDNL